MRKILAALLCGVLLLSFHGCAFLKMEAEPKVEAMLEALSEADREAALELIHPDAKSEAEGLEQLIVMIDGRKVERLTCTGIQKSVNAGSNGIVHTESGSYQVLFDDGTEMALSVTYCSDSTGEGFYRFWGQMQESTPIKT